MMRHAIGLFSATVSQCRGGGSDIRK